MEKGIHSRVFPFFIFIMKYKCNMSGGIRFFYDNDSNVAPDSFLCYVFYY